MGTNTYTKNIKGRDYLYEQVPYRDALGRPRNKMKYLGPKYPRRHRKSQIAQLLVSLFILGVSPEARKIPAPKKPKQHVKDLRARRLHIPPTLEQIWEESRQSKARRNDPPPTPEQLAEHAAWKAFGERIDAQQAARHAAAQAAASAQTPEEPEQSDEAPVPDEGEPAAEPEQDADLSPSSDEGSGSPDTPDGH